MNFTKVRDVKSPERGTPYSAGIDFFVPKFDDKFISDFNSKNNFKIMLYKDVENDVMCIHLNPLDRVLIPSGIHINLPKGFALMAKNKGSIATQRGLDKLAELVDEDYQGELHISLVNVSGDNIRIYSDDKIVQFVLVPVDYSIPTEVDSLEKLHPVKTIRGEGAFGSPNKQ